MKSFTRFLCPIAIILAIGVSLMACDPDEKTETFLNVSNNTLSFFDGNTTQTIKIVANVEWEISGVPAWLNVTPTSGKGEETVTVVAQSIADGETRSAKLIVSGAGRTKEIAVSQTGKEKSDPAPDPVTNNLCPDSNHPHMIDLGTGVKWACCNVGANKPESCGDYYAWGETTTKSNYSESNYTRSSVTSSISGTSYDVAKAKWGGRWCMPTDADFYELEEKCSFTRATINGVEGFTFTASNGNRIFFPAGGLKLGNKVEDSETAQYWSGTIFVYDKESAWYIFCYDEGQSCLNTLNTYPRYVGLLVRPVYR